MKRNVYSVSFSPGGMSGLGPTVKVIARDVFLAATRACNILGRSDVCAVILNQSDVYV